MCINLSFYNVSQLLNALSNIAFDIANILTFYIFIKFFITQAAGRLMWCSVLC